jgi:hypothetical protein
MPPARLRFVLGSWAGQAADGLSMPQVRCLPEADGNVWQGPHGLLVPRRAHLRTGCIRATWGLALGPRCPVYVRGRAGHRDLPCSLSTAVLCSRH